MQHTHTAVVVGTGFIGPVHVEGLRRAGVHVAGIAGSSPDTSTPPPFPMFADSHREILLCEAILRSHHEQRWVDVQEPPR